MDLFAIRGDRPGRGLNLFEQFLPLAQLFITGHQARDLPVF